MQRTVRNKHWASKQLGPKKVYNKKLYKRNEDWDPDEIMEGTAEIAMVHFAEALSKKCKLTEIQHKSSNLSRLQNITLKSIKENTDIKIVMADKNLGPCAMTTHDHNKEIWKTHLSNKDRYQSLTEEEAKNRLDETLQKCI